MFSSNRSASSGTSIKGLSGGSGGFSSKTPGESWSPLPSAWSWSEFSLAEMEDTFRFEDELESARFSAGKCLKEEESVGIHEEIHEEYSKAFISMINVV